MINLSQGFVGKKPCKYCGKMSVKYRKGFVVEDKTGVKKYNCRSCKETGLDKKHYDKENTNDI